MRPDTLRLAVQIRGTLRGVPVDVEGTVRLIDDVVSMQFDEREYSARIERVDGVVWEAPVLTVYIGRDEIQLSGHAGLEPLGSQIVSAALALPEFTRTMHGLGSRRGHPGPDHDRFFAGLLAARRAAEGFVEPESRLAAFDSQRLTRALTTLLGELANERFAESPPDRRALEAELLEYAEPVFAALEALQEAAEQVRASATPVRLARWRRWTWATQRVFDEADRCWIAVLPALSASPLARRRRRFWRRATGMALFLPAVIQAAVTAVRTTPRS